MKTCPYCKEEVHDDAIKCRHCHSMLLRLDHPEQTQDSSRITYVLDRDLVRFGKFSGAVLAIFLVVGAYLFGFKLESALEKVRDTQEALKTTQEKMASTQKELEAAQSTVKSLKQDVEKVLAEARGYVGEISAQRTQALALVVSMKGLTESQTANLDEERNRNPTEFRRTDKNNPVLARLWPVSKSLRIRFLTGDDATRKKVEEIAAEWTRFANITFAFGDHREAEIRIQLTPPSGGNWSYLGTDALAIPANQPTMTLGVLGSSVTDEEFRFAVLHEFGHVLGLIHETQNPNAAIPWNREAVFREYGSPPHSWPTEVIEQQVFRKINIPPDSYRRFDALSIMWYELPEKLFTKPLQQRTRSDLSESDRVFVSQLYPRDDATSTTGNPNR
jgi:hypothetical protein